MPSFVVFQRFVDLVFSNKRLSPQNPQRFIEFTLVYSLCSFGQMNAAICDEVLRQEEKVARTREERRYLLLLFVIPRRLIL